MKTSATQDQQQQPGRSKSCFNCGQGGHFAKSDTCPARNKKCGNCGKTGHFARACRQGSRHRSKSRSRHQRRSASTNKVSESDDQFDDTDSELTEVCSICIHSVTSSQVGTFKQVTCFVDNVPLKLIVDTGAKLSIISKAHYSTYLSQHKLSKPGLSLKNFDGKPISCIGCITVPVHLGDKLLPSFTFYVTELGESMMGVNLFDAPCYQGYSKDPHRPPSLINSTSRVYTSTLILSRKPINGHTTSAFTMPYTNRPSRSASHKQLCSNGSFSRPL